MEENSQEAATPLSECRKNAFQKQLFLGVCHVGMSVPELSGGQITEVAIHIRTTQDGAPSRICKLEAPPQASPR